MRLILILFLTVSSFASLAQQYDNIRYRKVQFADTLNFDTLSIVPNTLSVFSLSGSKLPSQYYDIKYPQAIVVLKRQELLFDSAFGLNTSDSLLITYRVFPYNFNKTFQNKDFAKLKAFSNPLNPFALSYHPTDQNIDLFKAQGLNKSGSISRGVMFGNNQDLSVNSNLNLINSISINLILSDFLIPVSCLLVLVR